MQPVHVDDTRHAWVDPALALPLLESVEELEPGSTGAFLLGEGRQVSGMLFVQGGHVCWAVSECMRGRLTDLLLARSDEAVSRATVEHLYSRCKEQGRPLGEALVEAGIVSPEGLREALREHTCEALLGLGRGLRHATRWIPHHQATYAAAYTFRPAEIFVALAAVQAQAAALAAVAQLQDTLPPDCPGLACSRRGGAAPLVTIGCEHLAARELHELARCAADTVDVAGAVDEDPRAVALSARDSAMVTWQLEGTLYVALCRDASELGYVTAKRTR